MATTIASRTSLEARGEAMHRAKPESFIRNRMSGARPISGVSEHHDTEFEDESDVADDDSWQSSSASGRRRSATTISSYDEVPTPDSNRSSQTRRQFDFQLKNVEGPRGPHLFRASQLSSDFGSEDIIQMSPLLPKEIPRRTGTSFSEETITPTTRQRQEDYSIASALAAPALNTSDPEGQIRQWSSYQVVDWMISCNMDASVIECFEANDINGDVLLDLSFEHLKDQLGIQSFGKRHQLWSAICSLQGQEAVFTPQGTPFQDISRPCTMVDMHPTKSVCQTPVDGDATPIERSGTKKRRGRKAPKGTDVTPAESVSIVAIEQLMPKPHKCHKGERCAKWRKQQRELKQLQDDGAIGRFPISPTKGGRIYISGDPGNAASAVNMVPNCKKQPDDPSRHTTDTMPSITASSDLLGPGQLPEFALHENMLGQLGNRDPQDNVRQFLDFQHVHPASAPPVETVQPGSIPRSTSVPPMFPEYHHQPYPSLLPPRNSKTPGPRESLRTLPKLEIPRSQSVGPDSNNVYTSPCRSAAPSTTISPSMVYRLGTPQSDMDVPVTAIPSGPVSRDMSQSVPANMQYRQSSPLSRISPVRSATADLRRPSMPPLKENEVLLSATERSGSRSATSRSSEESHGSPTKVSLRRTKSIHDPKRGEPAVRQFGYGEDCTHAGFMKKRKTKLLRHEWQEGHFRLNGSELSMHENARLSASAMERINVENYGVACASNVSSGKLSAAMKAFHISRSNSADPTKADKTAFNFQLVPNKDGSDRKAAANGKTHHFAVNTKDERIDWMRELMLARALQQKGRGYDVEVNGQRF